MKHVYYVNHITQEVANQIWDILVETCGASETSLAFGRDAFIRCATDSWTEFRFGGELGGGGKVYNNGTFYVATYREEETPRRIKMMEKANQRLSALHVNYARSLLGDAE